MNPDYPMPPQWVVVAQAWITAIVLLAVFLLIQRREKKGR